MNFPYIALALGLLLLVFVLRGSQTDANGDTAVPLLTLLVMSEFAFFVNAIGTYIGIKHVLSEGVKPFYTAITVLCGLLSLRFLLLGIELWPL